MFGDTVGDNPDHSGMPVVTGQNQRLVLLPFRMSGKRAVHFCNFIRPLSPPKCDGTQRCAMLPNP